MRVDERWDTMQGLAVPGLLGTLDHNRIFIFYAHTRTLGFPFLVDGHNITETMPNEQI